MRRIHFGHYVMFIGCMMLGEQLFAATAASPAAPTADTTLVGIANSAKAVGPLPGAVDSHMASYLKYHFAPAATRLSTVCSMTLPTPTVLGTIAPSDQGAIVGVANNTDMTFLVRQSGQTIGEVQVGWNSDIILNLAVLSEAATAATTTASLSSLAFVPITESTQSPQLLVRVMTGQQLFNYIQNIENQESQALTSLETQKGMTAIVWYKNGTNPLPQAGELTAISPDLYLVVENEALSTTSGTTATPLPVAVKRIQVLNLSNLESKMYTVSLSINNMGLVWHQNNNLVSMSEDLESYSVISIQSVHVLDEVTGHNVPLLLMPRAVYQAGSTVNGLYASYIQAYANAIGKSNAGIAPVYYDLSMIYTHEPFEYLRLLQYFDVDSSLRAVVDQEAAMQSGKIIGSMIFTDLYGEVTQAVSPDISWVACNSSNELDATDYEHILFSVVNTAPSLPKAVPVAPTNSQPGMFAYHGPNITMLDDQGTQKLMQGMLQQQAAQSEPDKQSPAAYSGCPITNISAALMNPDDWHNGGGFFHVHVQSVSNLHWQSTDTWYDSRAFNGDPTQFTVGASYNNVGSFPTAWWNLTLAQWNAGIKIVPVFYDATKNVPFTSTQDFDRVSTTHQAALYWYAYDAVTGKRLGIIPIVNTANTAVSTYPTAVPYMFIWRNKTFDTNAWQSPQYESFGVAVPGQTGLKNVGQCNFEYPGYGYFLKHSKSINLMSIRNKYPTLDSVLEDVNQYWSMQNALEGSWVVAVPTTDAKKGISVEIISKGSDLYQVTVFDASKKVIGFQQINAPAGATKLVAGHITTAGSVQSFTKLMPLASGKNYFNLQDTASGIVLRPAKKLKAAAVPARPARKKIPKAILD